MRDLTELNLSLLLALEALLAELNVTRAARRLGVTQPTMSRSLRRLREQLGDDLLVRSGQGFVRTARAERIHASLRDGLQALRRALRTPDFDPATARHTVALAAQDVVGVFLLPALLQRLESAAPGLSLDVVPLARADVAAQLEGGALDLAIGVQLPEAAGLRRQLLFRDGWVCLTRRDHPTLAEALTLAEFARLPHALASPDGDGPGVVDRALEAQGFRRMVAYRTRYFTGAAIAVASSDLILTMPARPGLTLARLLHLRADPPPLALPTVDVEAVWHARLDADPLHAWVRARLVEAAG